MHVLRSLGGFLVLFSHFSSSVASLMEILMIGARRRRRSFCVPAKFRVAHVAILKQRRSTSVYVSVTKRLDRSACEAGTLTRTHCRWSSTFRALDWLKASCGNSKTGIETCSIHVFALVSCEFLNEDFSLMGHSERRLFSERKAANIFVCHNQTRIMFEL